MPRLAFTTFAVLRAPLGDPQVQGFVDRLADTFGAADGFEGFVDRSRRDPVTLRHSWGDPVHPNFHDPARHAGVAFTLSLWRTLESVNAYAYAGVHGEALRHRTEWFVKPQWPSYAAWWVADDHVPDWHEACRRLEQLHEHGATPRAFDFRTPFGPDQAPATIDRDAVREIVRRAAPAPGAQAARQDERDAIVRATMSPRRDAAG
jgi:hypothetical protein